VNSCPKKKKREAEGIYASKKLEAKEWHVNVQRDFGPSCRTAEVGRA